MRFLSLLTTGLLVPVIALAAMYTDDSLPYSDVSGLSRSARIGISTLTEEGIVEGNPDGTFKPNAFLNRAEFTKVVMGLTDAQPTRIGTPCFPDVPAGIWYEQPVCRAKALGIVRGNALEGIDPSKWQFKPERPVSYAEAVKILIEIYAIPHETTDVWYEGYLDAATENDLSLQGFAADSLLTRADMARLTTGFFAFNRGDLADLRAAERGEESSSSSATSSLSSSSSPSSSSSSSSAQTDPYGDTTIRSQFLVLGEVSPVLGGIDIFSYNEPLDVRTVTVNLTSSAPSTVRSCLFYDEEKRLLGRALLDPTQPSNRTYVAQIPAGTFIAPHREDASLYVRADIAKKDDGGTTQTTVQISTIQVKGDGAWTSEELSRTTTESFLAFQTARSKITKIARSGPVEGVLSGGVDQTIGAFTFEGRIGDPGADLEVTDLVFAVTKSANVSLTNARLGVKGFNEYMNCVTSSTQITCSSISRTYGSIRNDEVTEMVLRADVSLLDNEEAFLSTALLQPGTPTSAGDIAWTDGIANFTWVGLDDPVAIGTRYER